MAKYNVGDKVRIVGKRVECWNIDGLMDKYCNTVMTIRKNNICGFEDLYLMEEDKHEGIDGFMWSDDDIVCKVEDEVKVTKDTKDVKEDKIVITHDGKITTATLYRADGTKETATARCAPEDKFDFKVGAKLALERLTYEPPVEEPLYNGKVVCVTCNPGNQKNYTVGKIYEFKNGRLTADDGSLIPTYTKIHSFEEFKAFSSAGFVEIVE